VAHAAALLRRVGELHVAMGDWFRELARVEEDRRWGLRGELELTTAMVGGGASGAGDGLGLSSLGERSGEGWGRVLAVKEMRGRRAGQRRVRVMAGRH
jgi:hypothetical protein